MSSAIEPDNAGGSNPSRLIALTLLLLCYEALAYWAAATGLWLSEQLALAPLLLLVAWLAWRRRSAIIGLLFIGLLAAAWMLHGGAATGTLHALPHVLICLLAAALFGRTLLPGRLALITRLALHVHGSLPADITIYTRRVTWLWFLFLSAIALTSLLLSWFTSLPTWSLFANVLSLPLVVLLFALENMYRVWRFPGFVHASPLAALRAFRNVSVRDAQR